MAAVRMGSNQRPLVLGMMPWERDGAFDETEGIRWLRGAGRGIVPCRSGMAGIHTKDTATVVQISAAAMM